MSTLQSQISYSAAIFLLLTSNILAASKGTVVPLKMSTSAYGQWYSAELQFGSQTLSVITDTGSADLWVLGSNWKCYFGSPSVWTGKAVSRAQCPFNQSYDETATFQSIESAWLGELYGQGDIVGPVGYEDVQIGSIMLSQQEIAAVNSTTNGVDPSVSGLMGLAFPVLDSVHPSSYHPTNISASTATEIYLTDKISYTTVIKHMSNLGITYFAFAMDRVPLHQEIGFGGYLSFGTLPPVSHGDFVTVPAEVLQDLPLAFTNGTKQIGYWSLTIDGVAWDNQNSSESFQAVVDSGNSLNFLPSDISVKVNAAFNPPGKLDSTTGYYVVDCSATPPSDVGLQIGGHMFSIDSADMIWRSSTGICYSSVSASPKAFGTKIAILGDAFLKNVVAVFDYTQHEMRFAPRQTNSSTTSPSPTPGNAAAGLETRLFSLVCAAVMVVAALI